MTFTIFNFRKNLFTSIFTTKWWYHQFHIRKDFFFFHFLLGYIYFLRKSATDSNWNIYFKGSWHCDLLLCYLFGLVWVLISDSVGKNYPILIHWCLLVYEGCKGRKKEGGRVERYLLYFTFISSGFSHSSPVAKNVFLDYLRTVISPKSGVEIH